MKGEQCVRMHTSVQLLSRGRRSVALWFSFVCIPLIVSQNALAITTNESLSDKSRLILKDAQQQIVNKKYQRALDLSSDVLSETPMQYQAQFIRAEALSHLGKLDDATKLYRLILKSNPRQPEVYNNLANLYAQQGRLDLARQTLEQGIATNEQYKTLYENLSAIYVEMARGAYSKALKLGVQAKPVQLKTLKVASLSPTVRNQVARVQVTSSQIPSSQIAGSQISGSEGSGSTSVPKPIPHSVEKTKVTKVNKLNSTQIALADKTTPLPIKTPVKVVKKEIKVTKPVASSRVNTAPKINKQEVITALHGWAAAWSAQAVDLYLSFYGDEFKPVNLSKNVWAVQRRIRIKKPRWVNVQLADFNVKANSSKQGHAVVQLVQDYRADNYRDKTKKQFVMKRTMDGWRILSEQSLAVLK